jgi:hypothetical protein
MKEANWKANRNADHSERAKTPKYANDWDLGQLGADVEFKEAKKAQDNLNNKADKDIASGDGEDDSEISSVDIPRSSDWRKSSRQHSPLLPGAWP